MYECGNPTLLGRLIGLAIFKNKDTKKYNITVQMWHTQYAHREVYTGLQAWKNVIHTNNSLLSTK